MSLILHFKKIALSAVFFSSVAVTVSNAREIKMVTTQWAPFYSDQLPRGGPVTEIVVEAFKRSGHQATVEYLPWSRALKKVTENQADLVLGAYYTEARSKVFSYSAPIMMVNVGLVANSSIGIESFKSLRELSPYKIGVSKGWANSPEFDAAPYLNKDLANNQILNIRKLGFGRVDMIAVSFEVFRYEDSKIHPQHEKVTHSFLKPLLSRSPLHLIMSKQLEGQELILEGFNLALQEMKEDGTYGSILRAHNIAASATSPSKPN